MASFESWMLPGKRRWRRIIAGYQDLYNDKGNWSSNTVGVGSLIGTNRSIAAPTLIAWRGRMVSREEMKALSIEEAVQIYRVKYWDKILGDHIQSQALADILADMKSSAGGNAIKEIQKVLNSFGESLAVDGAFGQLTLNALNRQIARVGQAKIYNAFRQAMIDYYRSINNPHEAQLISSLEKDYPPMSENFFLQNWKWFALGGAVLVLLYFLYRYKYLSYGS